LAAWLALKHTDEDLRALREAIDEADKASEAGDTVAFGWAAARIHETLMERSGNRALAIMSRLLHELVQEYYGRSASLSDVAKLRRAVRSYRKLLRLIEAEAADSAESHWRTHMSYTIDNQDRSQPLDLFSK